MLPLSLCLLPLSLTACGDDGPSGDDEAGENGTDEADTTDTGETSYVEAEFQVRESVKQLHITHAEPDMVLRVLDGAGMEVATGTVDQWGSLIFRELTPGEGYSVEETVGVELEAARELKVWDTEESYPEQSFYDGQTLQPGYNYITTRDGTQLSAYVFLPGPIEDGPYPTIVNYSGYEPSKPGGPVSEQFGELGGIDLDSLCPLFPVICDAPNSPAGLLGGFMGFASVNVNMRGTGCSGGAYDFFEELQVLDGYDIVEVAAAQDWVLDNKVAMAGLSYPGISQMWVAQTQPPSLAAIAPMSVFAHTADSTLRPGGITNNGFAVNWAQNVLNSAVPYGKGWEQGLVDGGDTVCEENQLLHGQLVDVIQKIEDYPYYVPEIYDPLDPMKFVDQIDVPVFITGAWQDEQTGGDWARLINALEASPMVKLRGFNGVHADGYTPEHLLQWGAFLDFYIREEVPVITPELRSVAPALFGALLGEAVEFPPDPYTMFGSYDEALAAYEAEDPIVIQFEMGANPEYEQGAPSPTMTMSFDAWPPNELDTQRWYFGPDGALSEAAPGPDGGGSSYHIDTADGQAGTLPNGDINALIPPFDWQQDEPDTAAVFMSPELADDVVMVGPASADLWIRSNAGEADIEVNVIEVRPDGQEIYVQGGWLRATERYLDPSQTTDLDPIVTHVEADLQPVPADEYVEARIRIFPFAHIFRAGSKVKISVDTPGSSRPEWKFILDETQTDDTRIDVGHHEGAASSVLLPVVPDVVVDSPLPACPLRAQPCREHLEFTNTPAE